MLRIKEQTNRYNAIAKSLDSFSEETRRFLSDNENKSKRIVVTVRARQMGKMNEYLNACKSGRCKPHTLFKSKK